MHPEKTAIRRKNPAAPTSWLAQKNAFFGHVLHYGRGYDSASTKLIAKSNKVISVTEYDPHQTGINSKSVCFKKYDTVLCNYVLNVLPKEDRKKAIREIAAITRHSLFVSVRSIGCPYFKKTTSNDTPWKQFSDGITNRKTFQKYFSPTTLIADLSNDFKQIVILKGSEKSSFILAQATNPKIKNIAMPIRSKEYGIGKNMPEAVYIHKDYSTLFPGIEKKMSKLPTDFEYHIVKINKKTHNLTFIQCPDFDVNPEPTMGDAILVKTDGSIKYIRRPVDPWIYHHKWTMVKDDYKGFDVQESKSRSHTWLNIPNINKSLIGKKSYWEKHIVPVIDREHQ